MSQFTWCPSIHVVTLYCRCHSSYGVPLYCRCPSIHGVPLYCRCPSLNYVPLYCWCPSTPWTNERERSIRFLKFEIKRVFVYNSTVFRLTDLLILYFFIQNINANKKIFWIKSYEIMFNGSNCDRNSQFFEILTEIHVSIHGVPLYCWCPSIHGVPLY